MQPESNELKKFVEGILQEKNLSGIEPDVMSQLTDDLTVRLEDQINGALLQQLVDVDLEEFEKLLDENNIDKLNNYFYNKNINVTEITAGVMSSFRSAYLSA